VTATTGVESGDGRPSQIVQVFEPNSLTMPSLAEYLRELSARRAFIAELAVAEVKAQRSSTVMGELWSLVDPLFQAAIYYFLFVVIRGQSGRTTEYVTVIIGCVFFFNFTRISISDGGRSILRHRGLVVNAVFPRALLPVAEVYKGFLATIPALILYAILHIVVGAPVTSAVLWIPFLLLVQAAINLGLALLFSTATTYFKDASNLLNYVQRLLMVATPVVYPVSLLSPALRSVLSWNPLFALFTTYQAIILGDQVDPGLVAQSVVWSVVLLVCGSSVFLRHERSFALHV
jgi:teichoic acid transport system permease protein